MANDNPESTCECVFEYNDDHHPLLVWQCPKCVQQEREESERENYERECDKTAREGI